jgi:hypothetical protein
LLAAQLVRSQSPAPHLPKQTAASSRVSVHQAWDEAAAQLRKIALAHQGRPLENWIDAVVEWHMDALFASLERNAPDTGAVAAEFDAQISSLRGDLLAAISALRAYVDDPRGNTAPVRQQLARLELGLKQAALAGARPRRVS